MHHLIYSFLHEYDHASQLMHGHKRIYQKKKKKTVIVALFSMEQMSMLSGQEPVIMQNTD